MYLISNFFKSTNLTISFYHYLIRPGGIINKLQPELLFLSLFCLKDYKVLQIKAIIEQVFPNPISSPIKPPKNYSL